MIRPLSKLLLDTLRPERMAAYRDLDRTQWHTRDRLQDQSAAGVTAILRHACARTPYYAEFCREAGIDPATVTHEDLDRFPRLAKRELSDRQERFLDPEADPGYRAPGFTGGSSGTPFRFFNDRRASETRKANDLRGRAWAGWVPGDKQAILWAHPRDNKVTHSIRGRMLAALVHRSRTLNAYNMDPAAIVAFHRELTEYKPAMMLGFSSSLAFLADYFLHHALTPPSLKGIIASAETLTDEQRTIIEKCFKCNLHNRYGSREFGVIAQQCEAIGGLHLFIDQVHIEILRPDGAPCDDGERGEIVLTDLGNRVMPFIRYRTGDLARRSGESCGCGRGFPLLESVEGRTSEVLVGRNGKYFSCLGPPFFGSDIAGIVQMQVVQERLEHLEIRIVRNEDWSELSATQLTGRARERLGDVEVEIVFLDKIPPSASGKFQFAISKVSPFVQ